MRPTATPFPSLLIEPLSEWRWPRPPFDWVHRVHADDHPAEDAFSEPCSLTGLHGRRLDGHLLDLKLDERVVSFRAAADAPPMNVPMSLVSELRLKQPLASTAPSAGSQAERLPRPSQERRYTLALKDGREISGRTLGVVVEDEGLYLFEPRDDWSVERVFVPAAVIVSRHFEPTVEEQARESWYRDPTELLIAIAQRRIGTVKPMGQALQALGVLTEDDLARALAPSDDKLAVGERLVQWGMLSSHDLATAIAHKMGHPLVDLERFPVQDATAKRLHPRVALRHRAIPIWAEGDRMIVCVDKPARLLGLEQHHALDGFQLLAALAPRSLIIQTLAKVSSQDVWAEVTSLRSGAFVDTAV